MQKTFCKLEPPLHSAGESFRLLSRAVGETDTFEHGAYSGGQVLAVKAIEMSLMTEVLGRREFQIDALRLEDDTDLAPQLAGFAGGIASEYERASTDWHHERRKNAEHGGLSAAVGSEQAEELRWTDIERDPIQSRAVSVAVGEIANRNNCRSGRSFFEDRAS